MTEESRRYLAESVSNDGKIVTFRVLSRALGINSNEAKRLLLEFYNYENSKRARSISATYLVAGLQKPRLSNPSPNGQALGQSDGDLAVQNSHTTAQLADMEDRGSSRNAIKTLTLVDESRLTELEELYYDDSFSVNIYSIQQAPLSNLDVINLAHRQLYFDTQSEDPVVTNKTYGSILNPNVKRRTAHRPPVFVDSTYSTPLAEDFPQAMFQKTGTRERHQDRHNRPSIKAENSEEQSVSSSPSDNSMKRSSSDLFKSFAKAKPPKSGSGVTLSTATPSGKDAKSLSAASFPTQYDAGQKGDIEMTDADDEGDGESRFIESKAVNAKKSKSEREAELQERIFGDDDDSDNDNVGEDDGVGKEDLLGNTEMEITHCASQRPKHGSDVDPMGSDGGEHPSQDTFVDETKEDGIGDRGDKDVSHNEDKAEQVTVSNGRRRGRRRIVRKRMIKDAEGYLVTREEPGWESFSEDDVSRPRSTPGSSGTPASSGGIKKGSQVKRGQGNIMSFFGKK